jgi:hypothetical protein
MNIRTIRGFAVLASVALLAGAFAAGPAEAKKKKKKKKPAVCAAYNPGEYGAGEKVNVVTDAATADAPVEIPIETGPGLGFSSPDGPSGDNGHVEHVYVPVQVDSAAAATAINARAEFNPAFEYDLFLRDSGGIALAYAAGYNPVPGTPLDGGDGGHSEQGAEVIDPFPASDCAGFTLDVASAITPGGEVVVKVWLGE